MTKLIAVEYKAIPVLRTLQEMYFKYDNFIYYALERN